MEYDVLVKEINPCVDEEVIIEVNKLELMCFDSYGVPSLELNKKYRADINIIVLDDLCMKEVKECLNGFSQIGNSFAYYIRGKFDLESRILDAGIFISFDEDEFDLHDYSYLDGKNVEIRVDRIKIEFID